MRLLPKRGASRSVPPFNVGSPRLPRSGATIAGSREPTRRWRLLRVALFVPDEEPPLRDQPKGRRVAAAVSEVPGVRLDRQPQLRGDVLPLRRLDGATVAPVVESEEPPRKGGVEAPGQDKEGSKSFLRALQATGVIVSIVENAGDGNDVMVTFDFDKPNSKFIALPGGDFTIPDGAGGPSSGIDLIFSPGLPIPDPAFPAHANCKKFA